MTAITIERFSPYGGNGFKMIIKKSVYPKTVRYNPTENIIITEKLDGSNLVFFKLKDRLYVAQRKNIFAAEDCLEGQIKTIAYPGLVDWLLKNATDLENRLQEGAAICGEWMNGQGQIKQYKDFGFDKKFYQFAKANVNEKMSLYNVYYNPDLFQYSFIEKEIPEYIGQVPIVDKVGAVDLDYLNSLYDDYSQREGRKIEGFVVALTDTQVSKYVRFKNGRQLVDHFW